MKIKINDTIRVIAGKDRGKTGKVSRVLPKKNKIIVAGINQVVKHIKPQAGQSGEKRTIDKPIDVSKVAIINSKGEVDRIGYQVTKTGEKIRIFRKTGEAMSVAKPKVKKVAKPKKQTTKKKTTKTKTTKK